MPPCYLLLPPAFVEESSWEIVVSKTEALWEKKHLAKLGRPLLPFDVTVAQLFILWIVSTNRVDAESTCTVRRSHLLRLEHQVKGRTLLERVYFCWCDFFMSKSRISLFKT
jgi:hypothetical protein